MIRNTLTCALLCVLYIGMAQSGDTDPLKTFLSASEGKLYKPAQLSVLFTDLATGEEIIAYDADKLVCPASVTKLLTGAYAYHQLGANTTYRTTLGISGKVQSDGVLVGDMVWKAVGDPSLGSKYAREGHQLTAILDDAIAAIRDAGIECIDGDVKLDISSWIEVGDHSRWLEMDVANYYGASSHAMNVLDNSYSIHLRSNTSEVTMLGTTPNDLGLEFTNRLRVGAAGSGDQAYIYGSGFSRDRILVGSIPPGQSRFTIRGSLGDPGAYFIARFCDALDDAGIGYGATEVVATPITLDKVLQSYSSASMATLLRHSLAKSDNLYAQALAVKALQSRSQTWKSITDWVECSSCKLYDGNGLSPSNALSARSLVDLIKKSSREIPDYLDLLPTSNTSRTLVSYSKGIPAEAMRAKTGSMEGVRCLSGVMNTQSGREIAFAVLINHYDGSSREVYDSVSRLLRTIYAMD